MEETYDFDLTTKEGKEKVQKKIQESLDRFNDEDKLFLSKLLYLLLNTVADQAIDIDKLYNFVNNIHKLKLLNNNSEGEKNKE